MNESIYDKINDYGSVKISLASPNDIRSWSFGEVRKPETINYRTYRPEKDGLFCERIFGPERDWECSCGKYKGTKFKGIICDRCGVKVTHSRVRRKRMGHINLAAPAVHIWFFKAMPSRLGSLLAMKTVDLEKIIYFQDYVVTDAGQSPLKVKQLLNEEEYREVVAKYGNSFKAAMGAEAIRNLLAALDLEKLAGELKAAMTKTSSKQRIKDLTKRLKTVNAVKSSPNKPEWMVLDVVPVIPPDLRPLVMLESGNFATSDLNDLYRRIINRNNRLKKLMDLNAPEVIIRNEKRMLQQAVDALFDNGRCRRPVLGSNNRPLKSLTDMIKGKQGRFRENLLGKRVDYSARSVIVVGPHLKLHQCGLPKKIALELFQPFIIRELKERGLADTIKSAKKMLERRDERVWDILEKVIHQHPVLLNRAPTLHRMGIQSFEPVLVEGNAIMLHPLVCKGFNADFDGDQMAVHLPLSIEAQVEAHTLIMSTNNIFSPANGSPIVGPSQDIVLGNYYITVEHPGEKGEGMIFRDTAEAITAYEMGKVTIHAKVKVGLPKDKKVATSEGMTEKTGIIETTPGRCIFNEILPKQLPFYNCIMNQRMLKTVINDCFDLSDGRTSLGLLDDIKDLGFKYATLAGLSFGLADLRVPPEKQGIIDRTQKIVDRIEKNYNDGVLTEGERYNQIIDAWTHARVAVTNAMMAGLKSDTRGGRPYLNPIYLMSDSGARGSVDQIQQLAGMRALMAKPSGEIIETPIKSNFREGLSVLEYFSSTHGARKGLADTALKTADSGYLTRKLADVAQNVIVNEIDCGTLQGITKTTLYKGEQVDMPLRELIIGRTARDNIRNPITDEMIVRENEVITSEAAEKIEALGLESIRIRSSLTCDSPLGICAKCYGWDLSTGRVVEEGMAVGIIAAQSIGEPGTQLTMRTFHTGGIASREILESDQKSPRDGIVQYRDLNAVPVKVTTGDTKAQRSKKEVKGDKEAESAITKWMQENIECAAIPFEMPDEDINIFASKLKTLLTPKEDEDSDLKTVLGFLEDRLMLEFPDKDNPEKAIAPYFNRDLPEDSPEKIRTVWKENVPEPLIDWIKNALTLLKSPSCEWAAGSEKAKKVPGVYLFRQTSRSSKIVYVGIASDSLYGRLSDHWGKNNVEGSTLRWHIWQEKVQEGKEDSIEQLIALKRNGEMTIVDDKGREFDKFKVPYGSIVLVKDGQRVKVGQRLFSWDPHMVPILAEIGGVIRFVDVVDGETMKIEEERKGQRGKPVIIEHKGDKHPQVIIEDENGKILDVHYLPSKARIEVNEGQKVQAGQLLARQPRGQGGTQDITGGLPRVTEIFEARKPKEPAAMAEISGRVELKSDKKRGKMTIIIRSEKMEKEHHVPRDRHLNVHAGDNVEAGDPLTDGPLVPHDILRIKGEEALQRYLLAEVQNVYRSQNVTINDKHIEVILSQMMQKVEIDTVGDSSFLPGDIVPKHSFRKSNEELAKSLKISDAGETDLVVGQVCTKAEIEQANEKVEKLGGSSAKGKKPRPATAMTLLMGITKAALQSESFISAASFQETTKVLTEAALIGKVDKLLGLKENVILGHLIPAGTAFRPHLEMRVKHLAKAPLPKQLAELKETHDAEALAQAAARAALGLD
jgi:DNA-directed RNA polymerase beta' subunit